MLAIEKIREDLVEVRYYYTRKKVLDEAMESVGTNTILGKVKKYNEAMRTAPPLLYDLYVCLYTRNFTQEGLLWGGFINDFFKSRKHHLTVNIVAVRR